MPETVSRIERTERNEPTEPSERSERVDTVDGERHFEFLTGFPCTNATCSGKLARGRFDGRQAVVCAVCEEVYYVVADP